MLDLLCNLGEPTYFVVDLSEEELQKLAWKIEIQSKLKTAVRICRGEKMTTMPSLYDEFSTAFQFPGYFGRNWNAFVDCMSDLDWIECKSGVVCITNIGDCLSQDRLKLAGLLDSLKYVSENWNNGRGISREPSPFHVIVHDQKGAQFSADVLATHGHAYKVEK